MDTGSHALNIRSLEGWALVIVGLLWLDFGFEGGVLRLLTAGVVGAVGASMGVATLLLSGDRRVSAYASFSFAIGALVALLGLPVYGVADTLALLGLAVVGVLAAGRLSLGRTPPTPGVPGWEPTLPLISKVALDEVEVTLPT